MHLCADVCKVHCRVCRCASAFQSTVFWFLLVSISDHDDRMGNREDGEYETGDAADDAENEDPSTKSSPSFVGIVTAFDKLRSCASPPRSGESINSLQDLRQKIEDLRYRSWDRFGILWLSYMSLQLTRYERNPCPFGLSVPGRLLKPLLETGDLARGRV